jgi:hypothetical protein
MHTGPKRADKEAIERKIQKLHAMEKRHHWLAVHAEPTYPNYVNEGQVMLEGSSRLRVKLNELRKQKDSEAQELRRRINRLDYKDMTEGLTPAEKLELLELDRKLAAIDEEKRILDSAWKFDKWEADYRQEPPRVPLRDKAAAPHKEPARLNLSHSGGSRDHLRRSMKGARAY